MSRIEPENVSVPFINLYLHRLFRLSCLDGINKIFPIEVASGSPKISLIRRGIIENFDSLIDLGYQNEAVKTLREGKRIQIGTEAEQIQIKNIK